MSEFTTQELMVKQAYSKTTEAEQLQLEKALCQDWNLREQMEDMLDTIEVLNKIPLRSPSDSSIKLIMDFNNQATLEASLN